MAQKPYIYGPITHSFRSLLWVQLCPSASIKLRLNVVILLSSGTGEIAVGNMVYFRSSCSLRLLFRIFHSVNQNILHVFRNINIFGRTRS